LVHFGEQVGWLNDAVFMFSIKKKKGYLRGQTEGVGLQRDIRKGRPKMTPWAVWGLRWKTVREWVWLLDFLLAH
jgi:hypothetical protein